MRKELLMPKKESTHSVSHNDALVGNFDLSCLRRYHFRENMYDNFNFQHCIIIDQIQGPDDDTATVKFIAEMILRETGETTAFMETSTFERAKSHGAWLYKDGIIEEAPAGNNINEAGSGVSQSIAEKLANML